MYYIPISPAFSKKLNVVTKLLQKTPLQLHYVRIYLNHYLKQSHSLKKKIQEKLFSIEPNKFDVVLFNELDEGIAFLRIS